MRPQFFPWLFDDKEAWEKVLSSSHFSYELPMDYFMSLYQVERKASENIGGYALPSFSAPAIPLPVAAPMSMPAAQAFTATDPFVAMAPIAAVAEPEKKEPAGDNGILSQDEIDALLSGL